MNGFMTYFGMGAVDEHDKPVERTKREYPYTYSGFVQERVHPNEKANGTVYSDRLRQWDYEKCRRLQKKHFGKETDYWNNISAATIEKFLRDYWDNDKIEVVLVMEYCNISSGYPLWRVDYFNPESERKDEESKETTWKNVSTSE